MASATLTDLNLRLLHRISGSANDLGLATAQLTEWINAALKHVQMEANWPWQVGLVTFNTVVGTGSYATPADWLRTHTLTIDTPGGTSPTAMQQRAIGDVDLMASQGMPFIYAVDQELINVAPLPNSIYAIKHRYYSIEPLLVSGSDTPKIPVQFDEGVIEYAAVLGLRFLRQEDRAKMALQGYQDWLKVTKDNKNRSTESMRVRTRSDSQV